MVDKAAARRSQATKAARTRWAKHTVRKRSSRPEGMDSATWKLTRKSKAARARWSDKHAPHVTNDGTRLWSKALHLAREQADENATTKSIRQVARKLHYHMLKNQGMKEHRNTVAGKRVRKKSKVCSPSLVVVASAALAADPPGHVQPLRGGATSPARGRQYSNRQPIQGRTGRSR